MLPGAGCRLPRAQEPSRGRELPTEGLPAPLPLPAAPDSARFSQQMVLLAHASAEKFCERNNQGKNGARRVTVLGVNATSGSHGPGNRPSSPLLSESHATGFFTALLLPSISALIVQKWDSAGCIECSGFLLTNGLTVLYIYLPFMVKTNIFTIHRCCEESTGEHWKNRMQMLSLGQWLPMTW